MERFLCDISMERNKILLIAPPPMTLGEWVSDRQLVDYTHSFAQSCHTLTERLGSFVDAGKWGISPAYDGEHFTEQGTRPLLPGYWRN